MITSANLLSADRRPAGLTAGRRGADNRRVLRAASLLVVACACHDAGREPAPPCSAVAAKFFELAKLDLARAKPDEASSRAVDEQLPVLRDTLARACSAGKWSETTRKCLGRANDHIGFETCEQQLTDDQRRDLDRDLAQPGLAQSPRPPRPAPLQAPEDEHGNAEATR